MGKIIDSRHRPEKSSDNSKCSQSSLQCISLSDCHEKRKYAERLSPRDATEGKKREFMRLVETKTPWATEQVRIFELTLLLIYFRDPSVYSSTIHLANHIEDRPIIVHHRENQKSHRHFCLRLRASTPIEIRRATQDVVERDPKKNPIRLQKDSREIFSLVSQIYFFIHLKIVTCVSFQYFRNTKSIHKQSTISPRHFDRILILCIS